MSHLLLGSIGVLAETSDLQRRAFNLAFSEAGLDWYWDRHTYPELLTKSGGQSRIEAFAERWESVDAQAMHARKSELFQHFLARGVELRPGVAEAMRSTRDNGGMVGLVTTTSRGNVDMVLAATGLEENDFDVIVDGRDVTAGKPSPDAYELALDRLGINAEEALAVEDNPDGLAAAIASGLQCIAFPGAMHMTGTFEGAIRVQSRLELAKTKRAA